MDVPLTPVDFLRRARKLHGAREAVVDRDLRLTYEQFADRCDRWSTALQQLGVGKGDRVAYISPNTHSHLEGYYAVPQIGAVIVPINYRLTADDFAYLITHSGSKVVCAHPDLIPAVDRVRDQLPADIRIRRTRRLARRLARLRATGGRGVPAPGSPAARRARSAGHQLHQWNDVEAEGRDDYPPQRLHQRGRDTGSPADAGRRSLSLDAPDVPCQRLDLHLDRHGHRRDARLPGARWSRRVSSR